MSQDPLSVAEYGGAIALPRELFEDLTICLDELIEECVLQETERWHYPPGALYWRLPRAMRRRLFLEWLKGDAREGLPPTE